jgi:selenium donor protein
MEPIYLDYNGTTPIDPEVYKEMIPYLTNQFGNPSSSHFYGLQARMAIEKARKQLSDLINCKPEEIFFTSSGTEANNLAIRGYVMANRSKGNHIITSVIEHPSVLEVCRHLEKEEFSVSYIPVDETGIIDITALEKEVNASTLLITIMHANNETGAIQPIEEISRIAKAHGIAFHTDASQSVGKIKTDVAELGIGLLTVAGHKLYAPKGIGALFVKEGIKLTSISYGAIQEKGLKPGTENVKDIVALGKAAEIALSDLDHYKEHCNHLTTSLFNQIKKVIPETKLNGHFTNRLHNTLNISFPDILNGELIREMPELCVSAGAACHSGEDEISYVIKAMGVAKEFKRGTIRISVGKMTTVEEIDLAAKVMIKAYQRLSENEINNMNREYLTNQMMDYTISPGCSCKINSGLLDSILKQLPAASHPEMLVDASLKDDAAIYRLTDDTAIVQTVDFLTPMVNDPYTFGEIAAANAISDIYAMGGKPLFALNIVGFPSDKLPMEVLQQIMNGASDKAKEAGIFIAGGHSIEDNEPKFGMAVTGIIHPDKILRNSTACIGDAIILTKPIGTGIIAYASKLKIADERIIRVAADVMKKLNNCITDLMSNFEIHACTDVTGFGLSGHLHEMAFASRLDAHIDFKQIPILPGVEELALAKIYPKSTQDNYAYASDFIKWDSKIAEYKKHIFCDAQTSGGLLLSVPARDTQKVVEYLIKKGFQDAACIGHFTSQGTGKIDIEV